jgi:hypothetical protein
MVALAVMNPLKICNDVAHPEIVRIYFEMHMAAS